VGQTSSGTGDFSVSWSLGGRLYLCRPSTLDASYVTSGAPDGPIYAVGRSASGSNGPVLFPNCSVVSGNTYDACGRLCVTPDDLMEGQTVRDRVRMVRSCSEFDPPFSKDDGDGRPGYESINIPEYSWGNLFVADVFGAVVSPPNLCDKKLGMRVFHNASTILSKSFVILLIRLSKEILIDEISSADLTSPIVGSCCSTADMYSTFLSFSWTVF
jgi:hypothetical protein